MSNGFSASLDDVFDVYDDKFEKLLLTQWGLVGAVVSTAQGNGALIVNAMAIHGGDKLRVDPCYVSSAEFCLSLLETTNGGAGVADGNALWCGLQNGVYNTDPTVSTKSIFFRIAPVGAASAVFSIYAKDGTRTYAFATSQSLKKVPSRLGIYFGRGFKEVQIKIDGQPIVYAGMPLDLSGFLETDWMQPLVYMKGAGANNLRLHHLRVRARSQRGVTRPPTASVPPTV